MRRAISGSGSSGSPGVSASWVSGGRATMARSAPGRRSACRTEKHWSPAEYSTFYVLWGLVGFFGLCAAGWLADKIGRRIGFIALLIWGAVFMTLWVYAASNLWLWIFGLAWSFGFLGFWGPSTTLTAEIFPTRIRGVANGIVWFIGYFVGFVLWPFATVALQQATGSFALAFLTIPVFMAAMAT